MKVLVTGGCGFLGSHVCEFYSKKGDNDRIFRLIEKPRRPINAYQGTGRCIFKNQMLEYIDITPIHHEREEKELPDLIQCCIDDGKIVKAFLICDQYANINSREDLIMAERFLA